jgi:hypothetical protein
LSESIVNDKGEPLTPTLLAYMAGFFDAEGSVHIHKDKDWDCFTLNCSLCQKTLTVLELVKSYFEGRIYQDKRDDKGKCYSLLFSPSVAFNFLVAVEPFLILKRKQAQVAIEFYKMRKMRIKRGNMPDEERSYSNEAALLLKELKGQQVLQSDLDGLKTEGEDILSYIAGFFDGEGCITITKKNTASNISYFLHCQISQKVRAVLDFLQLNLGGKVIEDSHLCFHWYMYSYKAREFLDKIKKYLIIKKLQAELAIEFQDGHVFKLGATPSLHDMSIRDVQRTLLQRLKQNEFAQGELAL